MPDVDPVRDRVASLPPLGGRVADLVAHFSDAASRSAYSDWSNHPVTRLVLGALRELAIRGPAFGFSTESYAVQYGMTLGLGTAAQILDDPSTVFTSMFSSSAGQDHSSADILKLSPDEAIDQLEI